ncbi:MAG: D-alanine--D-alanine ligase [Proteobacteria bacterium]|nr:D-alanine--D-alanine ligase [Pseudomonadota bacterium]
MKKRVLVLMGGVSAEREVSLVSGAAVAKALSQFGHDVRTYQVTADVEAFVRALYPKPDVVFNALHGRFGEDGCVQGLLELVCVPYTHSGVRASSVAMDKPATKRAVECVGVRTPNGKVVSRKELAKGDPLPRPYVVKPVAEGSTFGVKIVREGSNEATLGADWSFGDAALVEEFIPGHELTVGVMGDRALAVTEIRYKTSIFDYTAKYTAGHAEHVLPAPLPKAVYDEAMRIALVAHQTLGCSGISRSDFRYDARKPNSEGLYFLEINTQPGFTPISLLPEQAQHEGISFGALCQWLVEHAQCHA